MDLDAGVEASVDAGIDAPTDSGIPCIELPADGGPVNVPLDTQARLARADVLFLIDVTASMQEEIDAIRSELRDQIAPAIDQQIPDAELGVATLGDFPVRPFGDPTQDSPFDLVLPMTSDLTQVQAAVNAITLGNGMDTPEAQVEALYQVATGEGIGSFVPPSLGCPMGGTGYPCFRDGALPIVLLFTDAPFHNGPGDTHPYDSAVSPPPHSYDQAINELDRIGARVIGFDSGAGDAAPDLDAVARDTNTLDSTGSPMVFEIGRHAERLGSGVVSAMQVFAESVVFDIDAIPADPDPGDGVDVTRFVQSIVPLRAEPPDGVASIDTSANVFRGVRSGTRVIFQLRIRNDAVIPGPTARTFRLQIVFRGDMRTRLGQRIVDIVIPGADGMGCPTPTVPGVVGP